MCFSESYSDPEQLIYLIVTLRKGVFERQTALMGLDLGFIITLLTCSISAPWKSRLKIDFLELKAYTDAVKSIQRTFLQTGCLSKTKK